MNPTGARGSDLSSSIARRPVRIMGIVWLLSGAAGALLALSGCTNSQQADSTKAPNAEVRVTEAPVLTESPPAPARHIYTARPPSEIEQMYQPPPPAPAPAMVNAQIATPRPQTPGTAVYNGDEKVWAERSWDVQITREWHHIVIHHSASAIGSAAIFDKAHRERGWDGLGYHFVIGNGSASGDGAVEVGYRWARQIQGAHAGNAEYNQHGIGICLVGDFQNGGTPSPAQMASLRRLVRFLQVKTGIPTSEVIGHGNVPGKSTECPGRNLDISAFRVALGGNAMPIPIHYTGGGVSNGKVAHRTLTTTTESAMSVP